MSTKRLLACAVVCFTFSGCGASSEDSVEKTGAALQSNPRCGDGPVGLSFFFRNGAANPIVFRGNPARFLQEIDISESVVTTTDQGIQPLITSSAVSGMDWRGVTQVEEIWLPAFDGTFTRERYYRNARWMENEGNFTVHALDAQGHQVGPALVAHAGRDDRRSAQDDDWTRRFNARQLTSGCSAIGNCTGATSFTAEALIQLRDALHPEQDARTLPESATALRLEFDQLPGKHYDVSVSHESATALPYGYGFQVSLAPISSPPNGRYYLPGDSVDVRVTFSDGAGHRLYPEGSLPTYAAQFARTDTAGLRYLDVLLKDRLYYALKHRESNLLVVLSGPTDKLTTPQTVVDPNFLFLPQVPFATRAVDGFSAVGATVPSAGVIFGGLSDPSLWNLPVSDVVTFTIPNDAEAGTYIAAVKARREFGGEALNRAGDVEIQVGQSQHTGFTPKTACFGCHSEERTQFSTILHGIGDRRACFGCHSSLGIEPDNALDIRVHTIHDRSDRFGADVRNCSNCHLATPDGPARGLLPPT
ncbi:MAG TPA: hypothetical protein VIM73_13855 [Polyangiaceae bacterium]